MADKVKDASKAVADGVVKRLRGLLVTGTNPDQVEAVVNELVAVHGEPAEDEPAKAAE